MSITSTTNKAIQPKATQHVYVVRKQPYSIRAILFTGVALGFAAGLILAQVLWQQV